MKTPQEVLGLKASEGPTCPKGRVLKVLKFLAVTYENVVELCLKNISPKGPGGLEGPISPKGSTGSKSPEGLSKLPMKM